MADQGLDAAEIVDDPSRLPDEQAWAFLTRRTLGRLGYHLGTEVHMTPVNYAVVDGQVLFRTAPGSKLLGVVLNADVAFEVDEVDEVAGRATSVVARGVATRLDEAQIRALGTAGPRPWVATEKEEVVAIRLTAISGRSFVHTVDPGDDAG